MVQVFNRVSIAAENVSVTYQIGEMVTADITLKCYAEPGQRYSVAAQYIGDTTLLQSIWRVITARGLTVQVQFLAPQDSAAADRRALAASLQGQIQQALGRAEPSA